MKRVAFVFVLFAALVLLLSACSPAILDEPVQISGKLSVSWEPDSTAVAVTTTNQVTTTVPMTATSPVTATMPMTTMVESIFEIDIMEEYTAAQDGTFMVCDMDIETVDGWTSLWARNGNPDFRGEILVMKKGNVVRCPFTSGTVYPAGTVAADVAEEELSNGCERSASGLGCDTVALHVSQPDGTVITTWPFQ